MTADQLAAINSVINEIEASLEEHRSMAYLADFDPGYASRWWTVASLAVFLASLLGVVTVANAIL